LLPIAAALKLTFTLNPGVPETSVIVTGVTSSVARFATVPEVSVPTTTLREVG
jgi:hypothetical protein